MLHQNQQNQNAVQSYRNKTKCCFKIVIKLDVTQNVSNQETFEYEECSVKMTCERLDDTSQ